MRSRLSLPVRLLVLLLVPVVILAGPASPGAEAATRYGDAVESTYGWRSGPGGGSATNCTTLSQWTFDGFMQGVSAKSVCAVGWATATTGGLKYDIQLAYRGTDPATGAECNFASDRTNETDIQDNFTITASQGKPYYPTGNVFSVVPSEPIVTNCQINEMCWSFVEDRDFWSDTVHYDCTLANLGSPNPTLPGSSTGTCAAGSVTRPKVSPWAIEPDGSSYRRYKQRSTLDVTSTAPTSQPWLAYSIVRSSTGKLVVYSGAAGSTFYRVIAPANSLLTPGGTHVFRDSNPVATLPIGVTQTRVIAADVDNRQGISSTPLTSVDGTVVGVGIFHAPGSGYSYTASANTPQESANGRYGVSDSSVCSFYWGVKIASTLDQSDEPLGPVENEGDPLDPGGTDTPSADPTTPTGSDDNSCGFSLTDPTTWAGGGICALVGLIGQALGILGDIFDAIAGLLDGLGTLLNTLFVPSPDSWGLEGLSDQFMSRPPASLVVDLADSAQAFGSGFSSGSCSKILDMGEDMSVSCNSVKDKPGFAAGYSMLSIGMWGLTMIAIWKMLASNLGDQS